MSLSSKIVVVFESVYSADGSIAPMKELFDACEQYHALSYVDDANGFLIYGPQNRLFVNQFDQMKRATFKMVSFSKAVGMEGGAITGPEKYIHAFRVIEFAVYCSPRDSNNYDVFSSVFGNMKQGHKR